MLKNKSSLERILIVVVLSASVGVSYFAYDLYKKILKINTRFGEEIKEQYINIQSDDNFSDVISLLESKNLLVDINSFKWVADKKNYINNIKAGRYFIDQNMNNNDLVNLLRSGKQSPVKVTFNNIRTLGEVSSKLSEFLEADSNDIHKSFIDPYFLKKNNFNINNVISVFIPNTYEFYWNTSAEKLRKRMLKEYTSFWNRTRRKKASKINLSFDEVSALASIVEKEQNIRKDERPMIAGLYLNRINQNMKLESDPTLIFALKDFTINRVLNKDKKVNSPYNTYKYKGLPPGPICIPSINSIDAVLNASEHEYIFMCAKEDFSGYHNFATNYRQHLVNARKYQRMLNKKKILR
ncbi:endolytic transglycosylase MltG [Flavobacteriales bacterium]|nr:endolytic transglycosylase MltG [Flavobacteriales bacterium]